MNGAVREKKLSFLSKCNQIFSEKKIFFFINLFITKYNFVYETIDIQYIFENQI